MEAIYRVKDFLKNQPKKSWLFQKSRKMGWIIRMVSLTFPSLKKWKTQKETTIWNMLSEQLVLSLNNDGKNIPVLTRIPCGVLFEN